MCNLVKAACIIHLHGCDISNVTELDYALFIRPMSNIDVMGRYRTFAISHGLDLRFGFRNAVVTAYRLIKGVAIASLILVTSIAAKSKRVEMSSVNDGGDDIKKTP
ncbi:hypothetical protein L9F63_008269, partial [Diploptera punctata]